MGDIYKFAQRVVVWIGPASEEKGSTKALKVLLHLGQQVRWDPVTHIKRRSSICEPGCEEWFKGTGSLPYDENSWQAIHYIFSRPWFSRAWVWQEIGLANQEQAILKCGDASILWKHFAAANRKY